MLTKDKIIPSLIINIIVFTVTLGVVISYFFEEPSVLMKHGYETFRFFTTDSNILAAAASLITAIAEIMLLRGRIKHIPKWIILLKYTGAVSVMLTFCTVAAFLVPVYGFALVLGTYFHVHAAAPLMVLISFAVFEREHKITFPQTFLGMLPMAIYGTVYLIEVVFIGESNGGWRDFYAFNTNGTWYITIIIMLAAAFVISLLTALFHNKLLKLSPKQ